MPGTKTSYLVDPDYIPVYEPLPQECSSPFLLSNIVLVSPQSIATTLADEKLSNEKGPF